MKDAIFISYARRDGADLALRLQKDLTAAGFDVWLDTQRIAVMRDLDVLPDAAASQREVRDQISTALASLAARDVTILGMYFVEEQTYQQIADTLAITPSRVCQLLWRAIARLRHQLAGEHAA